MENFHDYGITKQLGDKPLRRVYLAYPLAAPDREVVLKVFDAACVNHNYKYEIFIERKEFIKQIRHDHLVSIIDMGIEDEQLYVVTPYISEDSLLHRLNTISVNWNISEVLHLCIQLGQALNYMHSCGIVHANIKPENILFDQDGNALLTDFSLAGLIDENKLEYTSDGHTSNYMAPEQGVGQGSEKSDQYALGCIGYELITGKARRASETLVTLSEIIPEVPSRVEQAFMRALDSDPAERYPGMATFVEALQAALRVIPASSALQVLSETQPVLEAYGSEKQKDESSVEKVAEKASANPYVLDQSLIDALTDDQEIPTVFEAGASNPISGHNPPVFPFGPEKSMGHRKFSHFITDEVPDIASSSSTKQTSEEEKKAFFVETEGVENDPLDEVDVVGPDEDEELPPETADTAIIMPASTSTPSPPKQAVQDTPSPSPVKEPFKLDLRTPRGAPGKLARNLFPFERRTGILLVLAICLSLAGLLTPYLADILQANQKAQQQAAMPTPTPSPTATPTLAPTPTPQPPLITSDMTPQQIYQTATSGPILYSSSLAAPDAASWNLINFIGGGSCHFANSGYQVDMPQHDGLAYCRADAVDFGNATVQVEMKVISGSNNDGGGIFIRDGAGGSYRFRISLDGSWDFVPGSAGGNSPAILTGLNQTNVLTIVAQGADLYLFINQQFLTHVISSTFASGHIGFMAACWNSDTSVIFNNIKVWKLR